MPRCCMSQSFTPHVDTLTTSICLCSFVKALYRSAVACQHLSKHKEAREQLLKAAKLEPSNKEVRCSCCRSCRC